MWKNSLTLKRYRKSESLLKEVSELELLLFEINGHKFASDIEDVLEVLKEPVVFESSDFSAITAEAVEFKGRKIPLINLRRRMQIEKEFEKPSDGVLLNFENKLAAFKIDSVRSFLKVGVESISLLPEVIKRKIKLNFFWGVVTIEEELVIAVDFRKVLSQNELLHLPLL